jgi:helicase required for RNAi-mediated heterochromatin assembly 1
LISGSVVVLSPSKDLFKNKASIIVATVAARPAEKVKLNPPEIDLFFVRPEELQIDPAQEFTMIEDRGGLFEANRYILLGLQRMMREPFPLAQHLVSVQSDVRPPKYVEERPYIDLSSVFENENGKWDNVSILEQWPANPPSQLDTSQVAALQRILTKQLAIIQGPPGTGKTHVSVQAIKVMLANHRHGDPPIIIACQTNHAIDQFLRHVAQFESEFCRLGGRSKDRDVIKKRTLYELQMQSSESPPAGSAYRGSNRTMADVRKKIAVLLAPLAPCEKPMDHVLLVQMKILTPAQANSLQLGASRWVQAGIPNPNEARSPFKVWLGDKLVAVPLKQEPEEYGFAFEEADLEFERLKEEEAENITKDDEDFDQLHGACCDLADNFTCWNAPEMDSRARKMLEEQDLWKIPEVGRGAVYRYLQSQLKERVLEDVRKEAKKYDQLARQRRVGQYENWEPILKAQKVRLCRRRPHDPRSHTNVV